MNSLKKKNTWKLVILPQGKRSAKNKWFFLIKTDPTGRPNRYKTRLVPKGYTQIEGIDYGTMLSPVARYTTSWSLRLLLTPTGI